MNSLEPRVCIIIPVYRHLSAVQEVLCTLRAFALPCFLVDDGNTPSLQEVLPTEVREGATLVRLSRHGGKGAACLRGAQAAADRGFSHGLFLDADGQHDVEDIPQILRLVAENPEAMILGEPVFDGSAPLKRRLGRVISNVWVWTETLSFQIKDSLCGFRCLPLQSMLRVAGRQRLGQGMDFDPNIAVQLFWEGTPVVNFPTKIRYPLDGVSNFHLLRDNLALFRLHSRLFFGMLRRSPALLTRHWARKS